MLLLLLLPCTPLPAAHRAWDLLPRDGHLGQHHQVWLQGQRLVLGPFPAALRQSP